MPGDRQRGRITHECRLMVKTTGEGLCADDKTQRLAAGYMRKRDPGVNSSTLAWCAFPLHFLRMRVVKLRANPHQNLCPSRKRKSQKVGQFVNVPFSNVRQETEEKNKQEVDRVSSSPMRGRKRRWTRYRASRRRLLVKRGRRLGWTIRARGRWCGSDYRRVESAIDSSGTEEELEKNIDDIAKTQRIPETQKPWRV